MIITLVSGPASEPVTLDEQREHMKIDDDITEDDEYIESDCIPAAREFVESKTWRAMFTQTWRLKLTRFSNEVRLPKPPLQSVTSITYVDVDGNSQVLATGVYEVDTDSVPGVVRLAYGQSWPSVRNHPNSISIVFVAGWSSVDSIPQSYKRAIKLLAAEFYENREESTPLALHTVPVGIDRILNPLKVRNF